MVTININIGSDEKNINTSSNTSSITSLHSQEVLPSPLSQDIIDGINTKIPSPRIIGNTVDSSLNSSPVPHPENVEVSVTQSIDQIPTPINVTTQNTPKDSKIPEPMDSAELGSASPTSKPKSRTTKRKSGSSR